MRYNVPHDRATRRLFHVTLTWQRTSCILQWSLEREFMYLAVEFVYFIVLAFVQLAVIIKHKAFNSRILHLPSNPLHPCPYHNRRGLVNFPDTLCTLHSSWTQICGFPHSLLVLKHISASHDRSLDIHWLTTLGLWSNGAWGRNSDRSLLSCTIAFCLTELRPLS